MNTNTYIFHTCKFNNLHSGLNVWQSSLQPNWDRQNFSPTKVMFLINSYLFTEAALIFSPTKRNLLLIL